MTRPAALKPGDEIATKDYGALIVVEVHPIDEEEVLVDVEMCDAPTWVELEALIAQANAVGGSWLRGLGPRVYRLSYDASKDVEATR